MRTVTAIAASVTVLTWFAAAQAAAGGAVAPSDDAHVVNGKKLTADTCANDHCHGGSAPSFDDMKGVTDARVRKVIAEGLPDSGMPSFRGVFTPEQVDDIVAYVLSAAGVATPLASHHQGGASMTGPEGGRILPPSPEASADRRSFSGGGSQPASAR